MKSYQMIYYKMSLFNKIKSKKIVQKVTVIFRFNFVDLHFKCWLTGIKTEQSSANCFKAEFLVCIRVLFRGRP